MALIAKKDFIVKKFIIFIYIIIIIFKIVVRILAASHRLQATFDNRSLAIIDAFPKEGI